MLGPSGITPLHVATTSSFTETMLNILTDDPGKKKISKIEGKSVVVVNMPPKLSLASDAIYKQSGGLKPSKLYSMGIAKNKSEQSQPPFCKLCEQHLACQSSIGRSLLYRPMLLSMLGIAAVCVCVGLLFKGPPEVMFVYPPFRWELLESGYICF